MIMNANQGTDPTEHFEPVSTGELNSWRRGFTPQAEIWNGRMAMLAMIIVLFSLLSSHLILGV